MVVGRKKIYSNTSAEIPIGQTDQWHILTPDLQLYMMYTLTWTNLAKSLREDLVQPNYKTW